jgi:undecaprenyl-diphosphatase
MTFIQAMILAIVEGLTEYLPISSTGHMIIASFFMGIQENQFVKDYTVIVQFGAILSVVVLYWQRFRHASMSFYKKIFLAFLPAAVIGFALKHKIDALLGDVAVVAWASVVGGVIIIIVDMWYDKRAKQQPPPVLKHSTDQMTIKEGVIIGFAQCLAMIPGTSRSAASIIAALAQKIDRKAAAEFSFFLAVPTLTAATLYKCLKIAPTIQKDQIVILLAGNVVSFIVGLITIRAFIGYLQRQGFKVFGYYRIIMGGVMLWLLMSGHHLSDI